MRINAPARSMVIFAGLLLVTSSISAQGVWAESYAQEARGDFAAAIESINAIINAEPSHEFAVMRRAWLHYLNGQYNNSIRDYQRAMEINDQSLEARLGIMLPLLAQQRWRQAANYGAETIRLSPWNYYAHLRLMVAEEGQRQWQTLARHAAETAKRYPSDPTFLVYWARALARQGNVSEAAVIYEKVLERVPSHEEAAAFIDEHLN